MCSVNVLLAGKVIASRPMYRLSILKNSPHRAYVSSLAQIAVCAMDEQNDVRFFTCSTVRNISRWLSTTSSNSQARDSKLVGLDYDIYYANTQHLGVGRAAYRPGGRPDLSS